MENIKTDIAQQVKELIPAKRVALVHDWLTGMRGGEMVLEEFCRMFPEADLYTLVHNPGSVSETIEKHRIFESPIVRLPWGRRSFRTFVLLFPWAIESFDLKDYDLVISTSHSVAKGVIPSPDALHVSYIHTPMRYVWDVRSDYLGPSQLGWLSRTVAGFATHYLRSWDVISSTRVDEFIANSHWVSSRIKKYYRRKAAVIHPPVSLEQFSISNGGGEYFLVVSALVPYKRVDIAVEACSRLGLKLVVVGDGSERRKLKRLAGKTVEFAGWVGVDKLNELYKGARALIHPALEDFGIVLVEAQASGRPVIAYGRGGALESVVTDGDNKTGVFFYEQNSESLMKILKDFNSNQFDPIAARSNSERFSRERFITDMIDFIGSAWEKRF
ncbi:MAG: glycosyltransferase [Candidatus Hatepunaea meridiana]|nr:glycosyltransferase [Candidatus Hatepunaea meridiana]